MVKLVLDDVDQISLLEMELSAVGIPFTKVSKYNHVRPFFTTPFLLVDGVPLDLFRSLKWIVERDKVDCN